MHFVRKHILRILTQSKWCRFRDMRPDRVDSNLYNYHLKQLIKEGYVEHVNDKGYRLSPLGLRYCDHVSLDNFEPRWQPKVLTKVLVQNKQGRVLMWPKYKQPFIGSWSLPSGKMHYEDRTVELAMRREITYFTASTTYDLTPRGVIEVSTYIHDALVTHVIEHVFSMMIDAEDVDHPKAEWRSQANISQSRCSPGTLELMELLNNHKKYFFHSVRVDW